MFKFSVTLYLLFISFFYSNKNNETDLRLEFALKYNRVYTLFDTIVDIVKALNFAYHAVKKPVKLIIFTISLIITIMWFTYCYVKSIIYAILYFNKVLNIKKNDNFWYIVMHEIPVKISLSIAKFFKNITQHGRYTYVLLINRLSFNLIFGLPLKVISIACSISKIVESGISLNDKKSKTKIRLIKEEIIKKFR